MTANITKKFRLPTPKYGVRRGINAQKKYDKKLMHRRRMKKKIFAKEIAKQRLYDMIKENGIQPQPIPIDPDGITEEIKYQNNLRKAYRPIHYQEKYLDPTPYISDQVIIIQKFLNLL